MTDLIAPTDPVSTEEALTLVIAKLNEVIPLADTAYGNVPTIWGSITGDVLSQFDLSDYLTKPYMLTTVDDTTCPTLSYDVSERDYTLLCYGTKAINLPYATGTGRILVIKNMDGLGAVTITPNGSETIDGSSTKATSTQYTSYTIKDVATGVWIVI